MDSLESSISQRIARLKARLEQQENQLSKPNPADDNLDFETAALTSVSDLGPESAELPMPSDPRQGWHLDAIGVRDVWQDYSGDGVTVGVIDDGFNYRHEDLAANYNTAIDKDLRDRDDDANSSASTDNHGTKVAGVIAAAANGVGSVGVAYDAELAGFRTGFGAHGSITQTAAAIDAAWKVSDVVNSSWAYSTAFQDNFSRFGYSSAGAALEAGVTEGRDGLGTIFVFAGGNTRASGDNVNYHNFQNSPYSIAVAGTTSSGTYASWSNPGAALLVAAPGSSIQVTTDGGGYGTASGTSFSAPIVAGVTALMLEANADLGYRDVQEILAYSASWNHKTHSGWEINGADNWNGGGLHFNHNYGFGLVDAKAAVRLAETWTIQRDAHNLTKVEASAAPNRAITDGNSSGVSSTINVKKGLDLDAVQVQVAIDHANLKDLTITLESPSGTKAVLADKPNASGNLNFTFSANNFWGEDAAGEWKLTVVDKVSGNVGTLKSWKLILHGDAPGSNDTYFFSDDYATMTDAARQVLSDDDGGINGINMSMVTSDVTLNMSAGTTSTLGDKPLTIAAGTVIQNAYLGDGNDTVIGNDADNIILGGRGNDVLDGGGGVNTAKYFGTLDNFDVIIVDARTVTVTFTGTDGIDEGSDSLTNFQKFDFGGTVYSFDYLVDKFGMPAEPAPPENSAPVVVQPIADKAMNEKTAFSFVIPEGAFSDPDGDSLTFSVTQADGSALPSWLTFDAATRTLSGTPGEADDGVHNIKITATDPSGAKVSDTFRLTVNDVNEAPVVAKPFADQAVDEKAAFSFVIPESAFSDPDGDSLTFSVTQADGSALPSWLTFDAATRTLSGIPGEADDGIHNIKITATDPSGAKVSDTFRLTVNDVNEAPVVAKPFADQAVDEKAAFSFVIPEDAFSDPDGDSLTFSVIQADGSALPSWLTFDAATRTLSGTPGEADDGIHNIKITATDPSGAKVSDTFRLTVRDVNEAPVVIEPLDDQTVSGNTPFSFIIPENVFSDPDGDNLTLSVTKADGSALPSWLTFDAATRTLSGTPTNADDGVHDIKITATDPQGLRISDNFRLTVTENNIAPVVAQPIADKAVDEKAAFSFVIPEGAFSDPDGDSLTFSVTQADGSALPSWLTFDAATRTLSGTPGEADDGIYNIRVTATDPSGAKVSDSFRLTVKDVNEAPVVVKPIADKAVNEKAAFSFVIPESTFSDPDGDSLTYSVTQADGSALPSWLTFDAATRTLSGTPGEADDGIHNIKITATDPSGAKVSDSFRLTVNEVNEAPVVVKPIADKAVDEKAAFSFVIPEGAFSDPDGDSLTLSVTQADGSALPSWLTFDAATRTLSGTPGEADDGTHNIKITATDPSGAKVSDSFRLTVNEVNEAPVEDPIPELPVENSAPLVLGNDAIIDVGSAVMASSLFTISDADNDPIVQYQLWGGVRGGGHWNIDGDLNNTFLTITGEQFDDLAWTGETIGQTEKIWLRAFDGDDWSGWGYADITTVPVGVQDPTEIYFM